MAQDEEESPASEKQEKTPLRQKLSCGTGHVLNDLFLQMAISFNLVFFMKVAQLDGSQAGLILLIALVVNAVFAPIAGYCSDMFTIPLISRALGRRKAWHLMGVITMAILLPLLHTRCLVCEDDSSWAKFAYYLTIMICINVVAFPTLDVGHLAIISVVAKNQKESVELNVLRTMFTYASGILAYAVTWIVLGKDSGDKLSPSSWKDFTTVNCILVGVGLIFSVIFHIGTKEPKEKKPRGAIDGFFAKQGLLTAAMAFMLGSDIEEEDGISGTGRKVSKRKCSFPLRKISSYLNQFEESKGSEINLDDETQENVRSTQGEVRKKSQSSQSSRKSSVVRKISAYLVPFDASILTEDDSDEHPNEENTTDVVLYFANDQGRTTQGEDMEEQREGQRSDRTVEENNQATAQRTSTSGTQEEIRKSSFPRKIVDACYVVENDIRRIPKTRRSWLKDPGLYRVCAIFAITQLVVGAGSSYMPFFLTDYLLLQKEFIAYFPLILLISGLCGTACSKPLEKKLGNKWTYCLAASVLIGSAVWFYFISPSITYLTYPAAILVGVTTSTMVAMSLTYLTELIGENKETSGFVCSVAGFMAKLTGGVFYMTVQNFYPTRSEDGGECEKCANFARHVYTLTLAVPTLLSLLVVLFFQKSKPSAFAKRRSLDDADKSAIINPTAFKDSATHAVTLTSYKNSSNAT